MLQVLAIPLITLAVHPLNPTGHIVVGPQIQGGKITTVQALQPSLPAIRLQGSIVYPQGGPGATLRLQPAVGLGINSYTLQ